MAKDILYTGMNSKKDEWRKERCRDLNWIVDLLVRNGIEAWIDHGTLLGIIREGRLITWDKDIDISVLKRDANKTQSIVDRIDDELSNLDIVVSSRCIKIKREDGMRNIDISSYTVRDGRYEKVFVSGSRNKPRAGMRRLVRMLRRLVRWRNKQLRWLHIWLNDIADELGTKSISSVPSMHFQKFKLIELESGLQLRVPANAEDYLLYRYGTGWMKEERNWSYTSDDQTLNGEQSML